MAAGLLAAVTPAGLVAETGGRIDLSVPRYAPGITEGSRAYFEERCKLAGEKVYQPLTKVRGIEILRMRRAVDSMDQWSREDPFSDSSPEKSYIRNFIVWRDAAGHTAYLSKPAVPGFDFVDTPGPDGTRIRYTGTYEALQSKWATPGSVRFKDVATPAPMARAKYGVTFEDISTTEDRRRWIAGGTISLIELATGNVVAERTGFMMDPLNGAGVTHGRQPWAIAPRVACPAFPISDVTGLPDQHAMTRNWLERLILDRAPSTAAAAAPVKAR